VGRGRGHSLGDGTRMLGRQDARVKPKNHPTLSVFDTCVSDSLDAADPTLDPLGAHMAMRL